MVASLSLLQLLLPAQLLLLLLSQQYNLSLITHLPLPPLLLLRPPQLLSWEHRLIPSLHLPLLLPLLLVTLRPQAVIQRAATCQ